MARFGVGLSGGVDSAVAAFLLKEAGHEVIGVFMRNWDSELNNDYLGNKNIGQTCPQEIDFKDAQKVATFLNIPLHRVDFTKEYWDKVFKNFLDGYKQGITPNPDIYCNKYIKFGHFLEYCVQTLKVDFIATGHYARSKNGQLLKGIDETKDQSYFLAQLSKTQLKQSVFPLGEWLKKDVRKLAKRVGLTVAEKPDSTGICFIGERNFNEFLKNYVKSSSGNIVHLVSGKKLGTHQGLLGFTIGQRKGLRLGGLEQPIFVAKKNLTTNTLYVVYKDELHLLTTYSLIAKDLNILKPEFDPTKLTAKFRYQVEETPVEISLNSDKTKMEVRYKEGSMLPVLGQQVVVYQDDYCVVSGVISQIF